MRPLGINRVLNEESLWDQRLEYILSDLRRFDELRTLLEESIRESEFAVRQQPSSIWAWRCQAYYHHVLASIAETQVRSNDCEMHHRAAVACVEEYSRLDPGSGPLVSLVSSRSSLAWHLTSSGRRAEPRDLLLANRHSLWNCAPEIVDHEIVAERIFSHIEFRHLGLGAPPPGARDNGNPDSGAILASAASDDLPATTWASLANDSIRSGCQSMLARFRETEAAYAFAHKLQGIAADQRRSGQIHRARQTVERLLALGRIVVERNPNDARAYLLLAEAFYQEGKNAWRPTKDLPAIELSLGRAIDAAQHAVELAPYDDVACHQLERWRRKLHDLLHP